MLWFKSEQSSQAHGLKDKFKDCSGVRGEARLTEAVHWVDLSTLYPLLGFWSALSVWAASSLWLSLSIDPLYLLYCGGLDSL